MTADSQLQVKAGGNGEPLLMIHGIIGDGSFFQKTAEKLSGLYYVITYDRRGYGESNKISYEDFSVAAQAEDVNQIIEQYAKEPVWILGNSAGGLIALEFAMRYPKKVKGMILLEPSLGYKEEEREKLKAWNRELNDYVSTGKIKRALPAFSRIIGSGEGKKEALSLREMQKTYKNLQNFLYGELNEVQNYLPPKEKLESLKIPVVIGITERGRDSIFATSSESAAKILNWPVLFFPGNHNAAKEMPDEFACMLHGAFSMMKK